MPRFLERDLSDQFISLSYQDVLQQYVNTSSLIYVLDGYGNVVFSIPSSSVGGTISTGTPISCSWASMSMNAEAADFALLAGDAITATSSSYALSASWAPGISGGGGLETGSTYPITASVAITATSSSYVLSASWAFMSMNAEAADFALLAGDAITAASASYALGCDFALLAGDAITATSSSYALSASWAPGISGGGGLETGSTYPITASVSITASYVISSSYTGREILTEDRTYYVHPTGSDSNNGLSFTTAFQTIQNAINKASALDMSIYSTTVQLANGAYTESIIVNGLLSSNTYPLTILGDREAPSNVIIKGVAGAVTVTVAGSTSTLTLTGVQLQGDVAGSHLTQVITGGTLYIANLEFGYAIPTARQLASYSGGKIIRSGSASYTILTGSAYHIYATQNSIVDVSSMPVTMSGTPEYSSYYIYAFLGAVVQYNANVFSGSFSGGRYSVAANGVLFVDGAGVSYLPGTVAGVTSSGGQYV